MIILLRLRNLAIFALAVLSISFIYIGYTGIGGNGNDFTPALSISEEDLAESEITVTAAIENQSGEENFGLSLDTETINSYDNFFAEFRIKRDRARASQIENLKENVNNPRSTQETINKAQDMIYNLSNIIAMEAHGENLLNSKGYEDAAIFIEGDNITVFVKKDQLSEEDVIRIGDLVVRATGYSLEQVVITPIETEDY